MAFSIGGNIVDSPDKKIFSGSITVDAGKVMDIKNLGEEQKELPYIMPGFIDAHVHIESSMLVPAEFARLAVVHGTVGTVSDPHEIANVCGVEGVKFMIENGKTVPFKFYFGAPSCVPATRFETAGASLSSADVKTLLALDDIYYLSEMMNFPGVLNGDKEVMKKINASLKAGKPIDGHAPGLRGKEVAAYITAGKEKIVISTDHECFTRQEALDKLNRGMKIIIREGSAAKNFDALIGLLKKYPDQIMFCSDDKHPDSLVHSHINELCRRAKEKGVNVFNIVQAACINPVKHYNLNVGLLNVSDPADFIVVENLESFSVISTYIDGVEVSKKGTSLITTSKAEPINNFHATKKQAEEFKYAVEKGRKKIHVIEAKDGQLITKKLSLRPAINNNCYISDVTRDIIKIVVVNRYKDAPVSRGFVKNFNLKKGAIASSVAHDSHNIIAIGVDDESIARAVNLVIMKKGGISCVSPGNDSLSRILPLPVGGLMSNDDGYSVAQAYTALDQAAKELGSDLAAPFMTLSFMALLVIPQLKISDLGLFDGDKFSLI